MLAIELVKADGAPDAELAKKVIQEADKRGLLVVGGGLHGNIIRFIPPLIITKDQVDEGFAILSESIQQVI
jgi:4-aminobutyrate aminotransferase-like enzyme